MAAHVRIEQLPLRLRRQIAGIPEPTRAVGTDRPRGRNRWRCFQCGQISTSWAGAQRHSDAEKHPRVQLDIDPTDERADR